MKIRFYSDRLYTGFYLKLSKFKGFEFNLYHKPKLYFTFNGYIQTFGDHPGFALEAILLGFGIEFHFYDSRHFDE